ncbi:MAG TPA: hypothetical protein VHC22_20875 [Pirellulales bacterium]|nr:hypothetical protein [Pirellulales bacterium]
MPTIPPTPEKSDIVEIYQQLEQAPPPEENPHWQWPRGLVPLIGGGCNKMECVDFLHPPYPVLLSDPDEYDWNAPLSEQLTPTAPSLADRLEIWLAQGP